MKIRPVGAELLHADGRTDMTKLRVALRNFQNTATNPLEQGITWNLTPTVLEVLKTTFNH
jgi:hypothetical protein